MARGRDRRAKRRAERRATKASRKDSRRDARLERKQTRQDSKTSRVESRTQRKTAAYEAGIDPNAWVGDTIGNVADAAGSVLTSKFQAENQPTAAAMQRKNLEVPANNNMLLIAGAGLLAFMMMRK